MNEYDKKRLEANLELVSILQATMLAYPSMRLGQLLETLGVVRVETTKEGDIMWVRDVHIEPWSIVNRIKSNPFYMRLTLGDKNEH